MSIGINKSNKGIMYNVVDSSSKKTINSIEKAINSIETLENASSPSLHLFQPTYKTILKTIEEPSQSICTIIVNHIIDIPDNKTIRMTKEHRDYMRYNDIIFDLYSLLLPKSI